MDTLSPATYRIPEAAALLGVSKNHAYNEASATGSLAGVPVIRVGQRLVVPRAHLDAILGIGTEGHNSDRPTDL